MGRIGAGTRLILWLAEFSGRIKPLTELASPELLATTEPLEVFLAERLSPLIGGDYGYLSGGSRLVGHVKDRI